MDLILPPSEDAVDKVTTKTVDLTVMCLRASAVAVEAFQAQAGRVTDAPVYFRYSLVQNFELPFALFDVSFIKPCNVIHYV